MSTGTRVIVEEILVRHEAVREAALIGIAAGDGGHRPVAFVTRRPGAAPRPAELLAFVQASSSRVPPGLEIEIIEAMPMTPTGKISKAELLDQVSR